VVFEDLVYGLLYSQVLLPGYGGSQTRAWECRDRARVGACREEAQEAVYSRPYASTWTWGLGSISSASSRVPGYWVLAYGTRDGERREAGAQGATDQTYCERIGAHT
jgi:hypothetical protein